MTPYHADPWLTVYQGDCREVMASMEPQSVHCVVTSPPYWGLRDYGVDGALGLEPTPEEFVANMVDVFREVRRVLRDDGTVWLNLGDSYAGGNSGGTFNPDTWKPLAGGPSDNTSWQKRMQRTSTKTAVNGLKPKDLCGIPWRVAFALQADGWYLRSDIIWAKPNPMPESVTDRPTKAHEYVFLLSKSPRYWYDAEAVREDGAGRTDLGQMTSAARLNQGGPWTNTEKPEPGRNLRSVWNIATQPYPGAHFATFPEKLVEPCIKAGCPDRACSKCGASWERQTSVETTPTQRVHNGRYDASSGFGKSGWLPGVQTVTTLGWSAPCGHDAPTVPGTVLDPFAGSGTTGRVAQRLSRRAVLIDLNGEYLVQTMDRNRDLPLGLEAS